ncbi:V-type immunoglobulin domain-containing suppressor of T-cell activation [Clupea harengus]|uniref:V-type immunoglobulin domain-containing suppressor of T-cell activation n=1 Tax=Clupea harengus TaxID=7950 RepID=UPI00064474CD|nr:V-type immunoglobulin domain-containing suppressor of T-cell activation [Clupea harengus]
MDFRVVAVCFVVAVVRQVSSSLGNGDEEMRLTAPHQNYVCPEGANVTLVCEQHGHHQGEIRTWLYTPHLDRKCHGGQRPRGGRTPHTNRSLPASEVAVYLEDTQRVMLSLTAVKMGDQGRYCCLVGQKHHKGTLHSHVLLTVGPPRKGDQTCTEWSNNSSEGTVTAGFATAACIMAFLCLPLILVLVYRQRQTAQSNRRAHELVRMDSEAQGHDNPVFLGGSPQAKPRTVSQIMTRQSSETGRHLLSDPGTPLTPIYGDVFFPSQEPIPESPDFLQV